MANTDNAAKIFAARFQETFQHMTPWLSLVQNWTSEMNGYGNSIVVPYYTATAHTGVKEDEALGKDITKGGLKWADPTVAEASVTTITADQTFGINVMVGSIAEQYMRTNFISEVAMRQANLAQFNVSKSIRDQITSDISTVSKEVTVATGDWGKAAHQTNVAAAIQEMGTEMDMAYAPMSGRYVVVNPNMRDIIVNWVLSQGATFLNNPVNDAAMTNNTVTRLYGFNVVVDNSYGGDHTASDDAKHDMFFSIAGQGVGFIMPMTVAPRVFQSEVVAGYRCQGIYNYGSKVTNTSIVFRVRQKITS